MTRLHIKIKDNEKAIIVLNLLKELPFVEIEESADEKTRKVRQRWQRECGGSFRALGEQKDHPQ